jgi:hypothetical protein
MIKNDSSVITVMGLFCFTLEKKNTIFQDFRLKKKPYSIENKAFK